MNYTVLVGRIATIPDMREVNDTIVTKFLLITSEWVKGQEVTEPHNIVAWGKGLATFFSQHAHKGDMVGFIGTGKTREYTDAQGVKKYIHEVILQDDVRINIVSRAQVNRGLPPYR